MTLPRLTLALRTRQAVPWHLLRRAMMASGPVVLSLARRGVTMEPAPAARLHLRA